MTSPISVTAMQALANYKANHAIAAQHIVDTSADVAAALDALQTLAAAGAIASIALTNTAPMTISNASFTADTLALSLVTTAYTLNVSAVSAASAGLLQAASHVSTFTVSDTAANVAANFAVLATASKLTAIALSGPGPVALTAAQFTVGGAAMGKLVTGTAVTVSNLTAATATGAQASANVQAFTVLDTAANISAMLGTLTAATKLKAIVLADQGVIAVTLAQVTSCASALGKLPPGFLMSVSGVSTATAAAMQGSTHVTAFAVTDTAANIASALDMLNQYSKLTAITLTTSTVMPLSAAQFTNDSVALHKITGAWTAAVSGASAASAAALQASANVASFTVADTGTALAASFDTLNADGKLTGITVLGATPLVLTAGQFTRDTAAVGHLAAATLVTVTGIALSQLGSTQSNVHVGAIQISDSAANILAGLAALNTASKVTSITINNGSTISVNETQFQSFAGVFTRLSAPDTVAVSGVTVARAASVQNNAVVSSFSITDTATNIAAGLTGLNGDAKLASINIADSSSLSLTYTQYAGGQTALSHLASACTLTVSGATAAGAAAVAAASNVTHFTVADTLANIGTQLTQLESEVQSGKLTAINVTNAGASLTLTAAQYTADAAAIALMQGSFTINHPITPPATTATINLIWDAKALAAPAAFRSAITYAAQYIQSLITNPITINISVGYGEIQGSTLGAGVLGAAGPVQGVGLTYTQYRNELATHSTSATTQTIVNNMATTDPTGGDQVYVASAQEKALGMLSGTSTALDGAMGFASDPTGTLFTYNPANRGAAGEYDLIGVAEHELTHALGRIAIGGTQGNWISGLDLFRYSAPGVHSLIAGQNAYFSINNGTTKLDTFSTTSDPGDWAASAGNDANDAYSNSGVVNQFSAADIAELDALGFATSGTPAAATVTPAAVSTIIGLSSPSLSFAGLPNVMFVTDELPIMSANLSGVEEIAQFAYGVNALMIDLQGAPNGSLVAFDSSVNGQHAIALANSADMTHGIVLTGLPAGDTAADLIAHHLTFSGGTAMVA